MPGPISKKYKTRPKQIPKNIAKAIVYIMCNNGEVQESTISVLKRKDGVNELLP